MKATDTNTKQVIATAHGFEAYFSDNKYFIHCNGALHYHGGFPCIYNKAAECEEIFSALLSNNRLVAAIEAGKSFHFQDVQALWVEIHSSFTGFQIAQND